ncbi:hypothetical protein [Mariniluteicoccus endophyticus]
MDERPADLTPWPDVNERITIWANERASLKREARADQASYPALLDKAHGWVRSKESDLVIQARTTACTIASKSEDPETVNSALELFTSSLHIPVNAPPQSEKYLDYSFWGVEWTDVRLDWSGVTFDNACIGIEMSQVTGSIIDLSGTTWKNGAVIAFGATVCERSQFRFVDAHFEGNQGIGVARSHLHDCRIDLTGATGLPLRAVTTSFDNTQIVPTPDGEPTPGRFLKCRWA